MTDGDNDDNNDNKDDNDGIMSVIGKTTEWSGKKWKGKEIN